MSSSLVAEKSARPLRKAITIRETAFEDYSQIAELHARNGHPLRPYEQWQRIWTDSPVYRQSGGQWPIGWVLEAGNGTIVGSVGNIPFEYQFRGRPLRAAASCFWIVDANQRRHSMALMSCLMRQENVDLFLCTSVNLASEPCYRSAFQFSPIPLGQWDKLQFWITGYRGFSKSVLAMKSAPLPKILNVPMSAALLCWDKLRRSRSQQSERTCERSSDIELCTEFDDRFNRFWEELRAQNHCLLAVRTRETLEWHYQYAMSQDRLWVVAICNGGRLTAYAIFDRLDMPAWGLKRIRLVDFQALRGHSQELGSVLRWTLRKCREQGIHVVEHAGCCVNWQQFPGIPAPHQRDADCWMYYYKPVGKNLTEALRDSSVWNPWSCDGDASL